MMNGVISRVVGGKLSRARCPNCRRTILSEVPTKEIGLEVI